jgi:hypothetical protein
MKSFHKLLPVLLLMITLIGCSPQAEKVYHNTFMGFKVDYPAKFEIKEYKFDGKQYSAVLKSKEGTIDIRAGGAGTMYDKMPFDEYVKMAMIDQVQNYDKLISIKPFVSDQGVKGYETYWKVLQTVPPEDWDKPEDLYPPYISGPIYIFPPREKKYDGRQPLKTINLSHYTAADGKMNQIMINDLKQIARSFRY